MTKSDAITADYVRTILDYNPETGAFTWKPREGNNNFNSLFAGKPLTSKTKGGYLKAVIGGRHIRLHRLAFVFVLGRWPTDKVDHANGVVTDNRWVNLREATTPQNCYNSARSVGSSGVVGVCWHKKHKVWLARINADGKSVFLGTFKNLDDAIAARVAAEAKYHGEFARSRRPPTP